MGWIYSTQIISFNKLKSLDEEDIPETCITGLEAVDGLDMISQFSVYQSDVERKEELVLDGNSIMTGPIKELPWDNIIHEGKKASKTRKQVQNAQRDHDVGV